MAFWDSVFLGLLVLVLIAVLRKYRDQITTQGFFPVFYFSMWRTKKGIGLMDTIAKRLAPFWHKITTPMIVGGFLGMILVCVEIIYGAIQLLTTPESAAGVSLVLPIEAKGVFYVPFLYWILSIAFVIIVHEGAHGVYARLYNLPIKSTGLAVLGIGVPLIPAAFVEPDEKKIAKAKPREQIAIFAAGPMSNIAFGFIFLFIALFFTGPLANDYYTFDGAKVTTMLDDYPITESGLPLGALVTSINSKDVGSVKELKEVLATKAAGDVVTLGTDQGVYDVTLGKNPKDAAKGYLGVTIENKRTIIENIPILGSIIIWVHDLFFWIYLINFGVGLFNLLPIGPVDGGRMLNTALKHSFKDNIANHTYRAVSMFFFILVFGSMVLTFFK